MTDVGAPALALWLEVDGTSQRVAVPDDGSDFLIGRSAAAALVLGDPSCSREHTRIRFDGRVAVLEPLAARQPTYVNDAAFDRATTLNDGDVVRCGNSRLHVRLQASVSRGGLALVAPRRATPATPSGARRRVDRTALAADDGGDAHVAPLAHDLPLLGDAVLGRDGTVATLVLDHPTISRRHAALVSDGAVATVRDLGSSNGTFVNGERVRAPRTLTPGDELRVGPFAFAWHPGRLVPRPTAHVAELVAEVLAMEVTNGTARRRLLDDVSVAIRSREFVAVIGPSGCGKSTLIRALSGRTRPTAGAVRWNGEDLHRHFDAVKREIAFVPQRETLPELLTVRECLSYTARLRLPSDTGADEVDRLVREAIARVGLHEQADLLVARLSGGQRKRASLANELLVRPSLMFLDEVTSGLDEATDREMMAVFRSLADSGIAVVCVTHTLANVERWCDSLLVMARGGVVAYHGPVREARQHFGVEALGDVYEALEAVPPTAWRRRHEAGSPYHARVAHGGPARATARAAGDALALAAPPRASDRRRPLGQLGILTTRYLATVVADRRTLAMAGIQSVAIAGFLRLVFGASAPPPPQAYQLLFLLGVSAFWFGCNNAAKEIIKERALFELERDVNLRLPSYVLSKLLVLCLVGGVQVILLVLLVRLAGLTFAAPGAMLAIMLLTMAAGSACGLAISAAASSEDQAITVVPIALIPQILLSDAVVTPLPDAARALARGTITTYWMYRAELQALAIPGVGGARGLHLLGAHLVAFTAVAVLALWWRDRVRRR